jgi:hypothetical protein
VGLSLKRVARGEVGMTLVGSRTHFVAVGGSDMGFPPRFEASMGVEGAGVRSRRHLEGPEGAKGSRICPVRVGGAGLGFLSSFGTAR